MMQGFHPFRKNDTVFQKTRRDQRLLSAPAAHGLSARPDPVAGAHARRDGADGDRGLQGSRCAHPAVGVRGVGGARRGLAGDVGGSARRATTACWSTPRRPDPARTTGRTTSRAHARLVETLRGILKRLGYWCVVMTHSHKSREHHAPVRHAVLRHRSADVGARSVLPDARRREPVRGGRLVLPVVGGGEPGADDHRAGAARGRAHPETDLKH